MNSYIEGQLADQRRLKDQQFQDKHDEIQGKIENLHNQLDAVPKDQRNTPDYLKMQDQLAQAIQDRNAHWKSVDQPNALSKFGKMLGKDLRFKKQEAPVPVAPPVYGQPTIQTPASQGESVTLSGQPAQPASDGVDVVDGHLKATRDPGSPALPASTVSLGGSEAGPSIPTGPAYKVQGPQTPAQMKAAAEAAQLVAAAPLSPEQKATQEGSSLGAKDLAYYQAEMKNFKTLNPNATPEDQHTYLNSLLMSPVKTQNYKPDVQALTLSDGTTISAQWDPTGKKWSYLNNDEIPATLLAGAKITPKPVAKKGLKFDTNTGQVVDQDSGTRYNEGDPNNPPEVAAMFKGSNDFAKKKQDFQMKLAQIRAASYGQARQMAPLSVLDTANGNTPTYMPYTEMIKNPGRYMPAGEADKALAKENLMQDIMGTSSLTRQAIVNLKEDFPEEMKVKIALAMRADDPHAALDQLIASGALGSLTNDQQDFLIATRQLSENAMAMRTILGAGQGSEDMRDAIRQTLPGLLTPDRSMALRQLDAFDKTIARLHRGVPKVQLRTDLGDGSTPQAGGNTTPKSKGRRSIKGAMMLPENKGKTEAEVTKHLTDLGYTPVKP